LAFMSPRNTSNSLAAELIAVVSLDPPGRR
jgi:hypothetical protein